MSGGDRERWQRVDALFEAALDQPEASRQDWLRQACPDPALRAQVEDLLRRERDALGPLESLAADLAHGIAAGPWRERELGGWRLVEWLGEGGMGTVWRAVRPVGDYTREAALKCLKVGRYSPELRRRFVGEQSILARLEHPNIARLYDAGFDEDGTPFLAMELVRGLDLVRHADARRLATAARVAMFLKVVDAVAYAHRELVVHRDLKPANILVDEDGEPRLLDFGIARLIDPDSGRAATTGLRLHTPDYAAPEQLRGEPVGVRTDIYALGLLLHELLAGERAAGDPLQREQQGPSWTLRRSAQAEAIATARRRSVGRLWRELRGDLDLIVQRCLRLEPGQRYPSAEALAEDLRCWQENRPISARRGHRRHRLRRFAERHWLPLAAGAMVLLSLGGGLALALRGAARADAQARAARQAEADAAQQAQRARAINAFMVGLFEADLPDRPRDAMPSTRELVDQGILQARDPASGPPALRAELMLTLGQIVLARQQFDEARRLADEARALLGDAEQADPAAWARAIHLEADTYRRQRRYQELRVALDAGIAYLERRAPTDPQRLEMRRERASIALFMDEPAEAEREIAALRREIAGRGDLGSLPLRLAGDHANALGALGRTREAAAIHRQLLAAKQADPATSPASLATTLFNLGMAAYTVGELDEARARFDEALTRMASVETPLQVRAATLHGLARLAHARGRGDEALHWIRESAAEWARSIGLDDPDQDFFGAYHTGQVLADLGRRGPARAALARAIERLRMRQDGPAGRIARAQARIAQLHCEDGDSVRGHEVLAQARAALGDPSGEVFAESEAACALAAGRASAAVGLLAMYRTRPLEAADSPEFDRLRAETLLAQALAAAGEAEAGRALAADIARRLDAIGAEPEHPLRARLQLLDG